MRVLNCSLMSAVSIQLIAAILILLSVLSSDANEILGCGGFVKSSVGINYSKVALKLYTASGSLKYATDCAPNNGYYFIPIEGKGGDHVLRIEPPEGWKFEPAEVRLRIDGDDPCSKNQDINFVFKGFALSGKVLSNGLLSGPQGVPVALKSKETGKVLKNTVTSASGDYVFNEVLPGQYMIEASHSSWRFKGKNFLDVTVIEGNVVLNPEVDSQTITVLGFDVRGSVTSDGEPIKGVQFGLFTRNKGVKPNNDLIGCNAASIPYKTQPDKGLSYLCHVDSKGDGTFSFDVVPPGEYKLVPFYQGHSIQFDVKPLELEFVVKHGSVQLQPIFQVEGFSVTGRVLTRQGGRGVANAELLLTSNRGAEPKTVRSDANGVFHLDNMRTGTYGIAVTAEHLMFEASTSIKISPASPQIADILVSAFEVCGELKFISDAYNVKVRFSSSSSGPDVLVPVQSNGHFCTFLKAGAYKLHPVIPAERANEMMFRPAQLEVKVTDVPVLNLMLEQFAAKVAGKIAPLATKFEEVTITLIKRNSGNLVASWTSSRGPEWTAFSFENIVSGQYRLTVDKSAEASAAWCWDNEFLDIEVKGADVTGLTFKQSGFVGSIFSSHPVSLKVKFPKSGRTEQFEVNRVYKHCLPEAGVYSIEPVSCHKFRLETEDTKPELFTLDTSSKGVLSLTAAKHKFDIEVKARDNVTDAVLSLTLRSSAGKEIKKLVKLNDGQWRADSLLYHQFTLFVEPHTEVTVSPSSGQLLFKPPTVSINVQDDCVDTVTFIGKAGLFVRGSVQPPQEGVEVTINQVKPDGDSLTITSLTDSNGKYAAGPFDVVSDDGRELEVTAVKEGFVFNKLWTESTMGNLGHFEAKKLAGVVVRVIGASNKRPLREVLISLSGGSDNYRKNLVTPASGELSFVGLSPGQYFLRSMLKEYLFEPSTKMIEVREGETVNIEISGTRTAYSVIGSALSLGGEPEQGIAIEAHPVSTSTQCSDLHTEEAVTSDNGAFRLRGLKPSCVYYIRLKSGDDRNVAISRTAPRQEEVTVAEKDIEDLRLIVFRKPTHMDVTGDVLTSDYSYLNSLKVHLYIAGSEQLVATVNLASNSAFFSLPVLPIDLSKSYVLRLETNLAPSIFAFERKQEFFFTANKSFEHFQFKFFPKLRAEAGGSAGGANLDLDGTYGGNVYALPILILIGLFAYNWADIQPLALTARDAVLSVVQGKNQAGQTTRGSSPAGDAAAKLAKKKTRKT